MTTNVIFPDIYQNTRDPDSLVKFFWDARRRACHAGLTQPSDVTLAHYVTWAEENLEMLDRLRAKNAAAIIAEQTKYSVIEIQDDIRHLLRIYDYARLYCMALFCGALGDVLISDAQSLSVSQKNFVRRLMQAADTSGGTPRAPYRVADVCISAYNTVVVARSKLSSRFMMPTAKFAPSDLIQTQTTSDNMRSTPSKNPPPAQILDFTFPSQIPLWFLAAHEVVNQHNNNKLDGKQLIELMQWISAVYTEKETKFQQLVTRADAATWLERDLKLPRSYIQKDIQDMVTIFVYSGLHAGMRSIMKANKFDLHTVVGPHEHVGEAIRRCVNEADLANIEKAMGCLYAGKLAAAEPYEVCDVLFASTKEVQEARARMAKRPLPEALKQKSQRAFAAMNIEPPFLWLSTIIHAAELG